MDPCVFQENEFETEAYRLDWDLNAANRFPFPCQEFLRETQISEFQQFFYCFYQETIIIFCGAQKEGQK